MKRKILALAIIVIWLGAFLGACHYYDQKYGTEELLKEDVRVTVNSIAYTTDVYKTVK